MYEVRFATKTEGASLIGWEPKAGDGFACLKREAERRWNFLVMEGQAGRNVEGLVPWHVEIVDGTGKVMKAVTTGHVEETGALDNATGPWAAN